ncbi:glycosyltransferase family 39 protein [Umezawaea sp.]|uniref:glycosyltransferase family 39 protein n=1 Tax=Umezawaea sp. TaxID=1955258 RepID=UPI002ED3D53C
MSTTTTGASVEPAADSSVPDVRWAPLLAVSGAFAAVLLVFAGGYGYYLDELYFRVAGEHLAWGYVDQPPLVAVLAKLQVLLFGDGLTAIRVVPALLAGASVLVAGLIAREFGGGAVAQVLAACASAASLATVAAGHVLHPTAVDHLVWVAVCWLVVRLLRTGDQRLWIAIGAVVGVGMLAKYLVVLLVLGLAAGLLVGGPRKVFASPHLALGAGLALVLNLPGLVWQGLNGWPQLAMAGSLSEQPGVGAAVNLLVGQVLMVGPLLTPVWVVGLVALVRRPAWRTYRVLAWTHLVVFVVVAAVGGYARYTAGLLVVLLSAGCVVVTTWASGGVKRTLVALAVVGNAAFAAVVVLPVLPVESYAGDDVLGALGAGQLEQTGWPRVADQVADVHRSLPPADRAAAIVYGHNYSEAGAIDRYGPERGLPRAYSGQNSYADFGTPTDDKTVVIAFGVDRAAFSALFGSCESRGTFTFDLPQPEQGKEILVCRGLREPWSATWPRLRWLGTF